MKKIFLSLIIILAAVSLAAQTPQAFKYQAIARGEAGNILSNWDIGIRVSIILGNKGGNEVYKEIHRITSNIYGIIDFAIGEGEALEGDFGKIPWGENRYSIKIEMDINDSGEYTEMGTTQLYAVPYALYAEEAGRIKRPNRKSLPIEKHKTKKPDSSRNLSNCHISSSGDSYLNLNTGNVGIGTDDPEFELHVIGNIACDDYFSFSLFTNDIYTSMLELGDYLRIFPSGETLPAGNIGELRVTSDGKLWYHDGIAWREVLLGPY